MYKQMNATHVLVAVIVGAAILAIVTKSARLQGEWQVQGAALSYAEKFEPDAPKAAAAAAAAGDGLTAEQHAEMAALKDRLAKDADAPAKAADAADDDGVTEGFEAAEMPYLGTEYASI